MVPFFFMFCVLCSGNFLFFLFVSFVPYFLSLCFCLQNASSCLLLFYYYVFFFAHSPPRTNINLAIYLQSVDLSLQLIRWRFFPFKYLCLNLYSASFLPCLRSLLVFQFLYPNHVLHNVAPTIS